MRVKRRAPSKSLELNLRRNAVGSQTPRASTCWNLHLMQERQYQLTRAKPIPTGQDVSTVSPTAGEPDEPEGTKDLNPPHWSRSAGWSGPVASRLGRMGRSVYIASVEGFTGKSTVALGVLEQLSRRVERLGVFRPIIRADAHR